MNFLEKLNKFIGLYLYALKSFLMGTAWIPYLIYGFLQFVFLILLVNHINPFLYPILSPLVILITGENSNLFNHYPTLYLLLPFVFQWFKIGLGVIFEGLVSGFTVILILKIISRKRYGGMKLGYVRNRWFQIALIWTIITAILWATDKYIPAAISGQIINSPRRQMVLDVFLRLFNVGLFSILMYTIPAYIIFKRSLLGAVRSSVRIFIKYPIFSYFLALIPILLTIPVSYAINNTSTIIEKFSPELVLYLLCAGIITDFMANYILTATLVRFLVDESELSVES